MSQGIFRLIVDHGYMYVRMHLLRVENEILIEIISMSLYTIKFNSDCPIKKP